MIAGYSFPAEDVAIRSMFLRAWDGREKKPRITVIQRGNAETEETYRAFFPRVALNYLNDGLEAFIDRACPPAVEKKPRGKVQAGGVG